jgi:hypothetical protein
VGSASTATALAANGSNCTGGQVATGVDASGNAEGCTSNVPGTAATITGDLLIGTTTNPILGRLAKGTQYQTLQGGATDPGYDAVHLDRATAVTGVLPAGNIAAALSSTTSVNGTTIPSGGVTLTKTIASGATAMSTKSIASGACASAVTATATGTLTTDVLTASFNGDPTAVTGYIPLSKGALAIFYYPTSGSVTFKVCNFTSSSITPGAITLNWRVVR